MIEFIIGFVAGFLVTAMVCGVAYLIGEKW